MKFLTILFIFTIAHGVCFTAILKPQSRSWNMLRDVVFHPYYNIYGELFFDDEAGELIVHLRHLLPRTNPFFATLVVKLPSFDKKEKSWQDLVQHSVNGRLFADHFVQKTNLEICLWPLKIQESPGIQYLKSRKNLKLIQTLKSLVALKFFNLKTRLRRTSILTSKFRGFRRKTRRRKIMIKRQKTSAIFTFNLSFNLSCFFRCDKNHIWNWEAKRILKHSCCDHACYLCFNRKCNLIEPSHCNLWVSFRLIYQASTSMHADCPDNRKWHIFDKFVLI